ncbi:chemotaxis protein CheW [Aurantivibrio infirmus]
MSNQLAAFNALLDLAQKSKRSAKGLPSQIETVQQWSGIGFNVLDRYFVAPMGEISELLELPSYTKLPGVQPWVLGVANVRGRLLPLFDLAVFLGGRLNSARKKHRVLVLEANGLYSGVVVDAALGMQHFPIDSYSNEIKELPESVRAFVEGSYSQNRGAVGSDDEQWFVFSPSKLAEEPSFVNAAS